MANEEAIELLTDLIGYIESENDYDGAIQMAIEALKVKNDDSCGDCQEWDCFECKHKRERREDD